MPSRQAKTGVPSVGFGKTFLSQGVPGIPPGLNALAFLPNPWDEAHMILQGLSWTLDGNRAVKKEAAA